MKLKEKEEARRLRAEGLSITRIARQLNVGKASVSCWVRDVALTEEQKNVLKNNISNKLGDTYIRDKYCAIRKEYQEEGRQLVKTANKDFIAGLMLFWAEGSKEKNSIRFVNSDINMLKMFKIFLEKYFNVPKDQFSFSFQWYTNNGHTFEEVKNYWLGNLDLTENQLKKCRIDMRYDKAPGRKVGKIPYGVGRLVVYSTEIVQKLFGAIQEYVGFNNDKWLF
jgi:predicted transcriptional regulator